MYKIHYPPELYDQITDILADIVLEDIRQFPRIPVQSIDTSTGPRDTSLLRR
jgi:hypothetical protein